MRPLQHPHHLLPNVALGVIEGFRERAPCPVIADRSQRFGDLGPLVCAPIPECGDLRLHGPVVVGPPECLGGIPARPVFLFGLQDSDRFVNVSPPARQRDVGSSETV